MVRGYVDSASIHGVMAAMSNPNVEEWPPWTLWSTVEVTTNLIHNPLLEISPPPGTYAGDYMLMAHAMRCLDPVVSHSRPAPSLLIQAENRVVNWARRYPLSIKKTFDEVQNDKSYRPWLDSTIENNYLVEHSATLNGLFDLAFIPQLAPILNCSEKELHDLWECSRDLKQVKKWSRKQPDTDDFRMVMDAYVLATLLRGRYHYNVATLAGRQSIHHPIRYAVLPKKEKFAEFKLTNTEAFFTSMIIAGSLSEKLVKDRIALLAENIIKARNAGMDLSQKDSNRDAEDVAWDAVKRLNLRFYPRLYTTGYDYLVIVIINCLVCLSLFVSGTDPRWGILTGPAIKKALDFWAQKNVGDLIITEYSHRRARIHNLSEALLGYIKGRWLEGHE